MNNLDQDSLPPLPDGNLVDTPAPLTGDEPGHEASEEVSASLITNDANNETSEASPLPANEPAEPKTTNAENQFWPLYLFLAFILGLGSGYVIWGRLALIPPSPAPRQVTAATEQPAPVSQVTLPESYTLPVSFGDIGPRLLAAGAIDYDRFVQLYADAGQPLTEEQLKLLTQGSDTPVVISQQNAYFLLNFLWAVGLTNQNRVLTEGPLQQNSKGDISGFASTGGWTIGTKPVTELYASTLLIKLTSEQQARLEAIAEGVYRPCCNNHTAFPDCNHGMAMLGLLELMAAQGASEDEMFEAAKYVNAFWFPQQMLELAVVYKVSKNQDFAQIDARELVGPNMSSAIGYQQAHKWLADNGLLKEGPNSGSNCGV
ncbi:MAG: hypothetical protein DPW09_01555 [Anaerolineae bacterium]|nr:hypothetical protein [Anaerolineae bacterium]